MKKKIKKMIKLKMKVLKMISKLQMTESSTAILNGLIKNEAEVRAQLQILRYLLKD